MKFKPILIVAGEPNSIFSEILFKTLNSIKIKKPIILIASNKVLKLQMKKLNFKKKIKLLNHQKLNEFKLDNKSINLINIEFNQRKAFEKISNKSKKYIKLSFDLAFKIIKHYKINKVINGPISKKSFLEKKYLGMTEYISKKFSNQLIQGFMDFGSIICTPRNPNCIDCIIKNNCIAFKKNLQKTIPIKSKSNQLKKKKYSRAYIFYNENNEILVRRRSSKGMLASMLEIPNDKWVIDKNKLVYDKIVQNLKKKIQYKGSIEYSFSHFDLETEVFFANVKKNHFLKYKWMKKNNFKKSGLPTVMKKIIEVAI